MDQEGGGGVDWWSGPPLKNLKALGFRRKTCMPTGLGRLENHKNTHQEFNVGPSSAAPVKRHLNGVSLAGRLWPTFICLLGFLRNSGTCMRAGPP